MHLIGDIHGAFETYDRIKRDLPRSIQLGDLGLGFGLDHLFVNDPRHQFIRGNHDSPEICKAQSNYLGDFGYIEKEGIFFLSGAWSIDWARRVIGYDLWEDEELSYGALSEARDLYIECQPDIVVTHTPPKLVIDRMCDSPRHTRTGALLDDLHSIHQPKLWVFAHMHFSLDRTISGVHFIGLDSEEVVEI